MVFEPTNINKSALIECITKIIKPLHRLIQKLTGGDMENHDIKIDNHSIHVVNHVKNLLEENIREIRDVKQLAKLAGYSKRWMSECFKYCEEKSPAVLLREVRYKAIRKIIKSNPTATAAYVANAVAPHWNEKNLYNFLSNHYQTNFTRLRFEILDGDKMKRNKQ